MCIELSQWDMGIELARQYNLNDLKNSLMRQAKTLLNQNKPFDAIELYKKSGNYLDAAKILYGVNIKEKKFCIGSNKMNSIFTLYVSMKATNE